MPFLTQQELDKLGFASIGSNVLISDKASIYGANYIHLGNNIRIDDFCVLSAGEGGIFIGNFVHIAVFTLLIGAGRIVVSDFANISSRVSIYSNNDDYSGDFLTNPMVPAEYTNVTKADVLIDRHVIIGSGAIVLPGVNLYEGVAVGSLSLVTKDCEAFGIYVGIPAKKIKNRSKTLLKLEEQFISK